MSKRVSDIFPFFRDGEAEWKTRWDDIYRGRIESVEIILTTPGNRPHCLIRVSFASIQKKKMTERGPSFETIPNLSGNRVLEFEFENRDLYHGKDAGFFEHLDQITLRTVLEEPFTLHKKAYNTLQIEKGGV